METSQAIHKVMRIAVGSGNPSKVNAVRQALARVYPGAILGVEGIEVESGVSCQPFTDEETYQGALTRAQRAAEGWSRKHSTNADDDGTKTEIIPDFAIGLEGGVKEETCTGSNGHKPDLHCFAWMVVIQPATGRIGSARTGSFPLPKPVTELVRSGVELGEADDQVFKRVDSKKGDGVVGILTKGLINRSAYYSHALTLALIPFQNQEIY